jgi:hypothetical protein
MRDPARGASIMSDTLIDQWARHCVRLAKREADLWSGSIRKIHRCLRVTFTAWDDSLQAADVGYTLLKLKMLQQGYLHQQSRDVALDLWERRLEAKKFGSVAFTTFNHLIKGGDSVEEVVSKKAKNASVMGPCMLSVTLTYLGRTRVAVDVHYRSTEFFKKFPADLILLRDVLLAPFDLEGMDLTVTMHFSNVTVHPMYFVTVIPHLDDPIEVLDAIEREDEVFHRHVVKATSAYLCSEHGAGIENHSQSQRVKKHAAKAIRGADLHDLRQYLREHHPQ